MLHVYMLLKGHGAKVGPGPWDPGTRDPGSPSKFKSRTPGPPSNFKKGTASSFFNEFIFFRIFNRFSSLCFF